MSKIYRITLHDDNQREVFTWDREAAMDALFDRYKGREGYKVISNSPEKNGHDFYFAVYNAAPFEAAADGSYGKLMANIHELDLKGRKLKL